MLQSMLIYIRQVCHPDEEEDWGRRGQRWHWGGLQNIRLEEWRVRIPCPHNVYDIQMLFLRPMKKFGLKNSSPQNTHDVLSNSSLVRVICAEELMSVMICLGNPRTMEEIKVMMEMILMIMVVIVMNMAEDVGKFQDILQIYKFANLIALVRRTNFLPTKNNWSNLMEIRSSYLMLDVLTCKSHSQEHKLR